MIQKLRDSIYEDKIHGIDLRMSRHAFTHAMGPEATAAAAAASNLNVSMYLLTFFIHETECLILPNGTMYLQNHLYPLSNRIIV